VKVVNAPFRTEPAPSVEEPPLWKQEIVQDTLRNGAVPGALALVALVIVFGLIRPALKAAAPVPAPAAGRQLDAVVADDIEMPGGPAALAAPRGPDRLSGARTLARDNPAAVANIVRGWVSKDSA
jgi:flagellar M-ring protein FliF